MKKIISILLALTVCAGMLCVSAAAIADDQAPRLHSGQASKWAAEGAWLLKGGADEDPAGIVIHVGDAPVVDAQTGLPLENIKEGDTLYAWTGLISTMSLPPQTSAEVIVGNVAKDTAAPELLVITGSSSIAENGDATFSVLGGKTLTVTAKTDFQAWLTRQIVRAEDLTPGTQALVWKDQDGKAEKIIIFACDYQAYGSFDEKGGSTINGEAVKTPGKVVRQAGAEAEVLLPLRAVAEAAGYDVRWDKALGAVVSLNGETVFSVKPGQEVQTPDGTRAVSAVLEKGVTYLDARELLTLLNVFFVG